MMAHRLCVGNLGAAYLGGAGSEPLEFPGRTRAEAAVNLTEGVFEVEDPLSGGLIPVAGGRRRQSPPAELSLHGAAFRGEEMRTEEPEAGPREERL